MLVRLPFLALALGVELALTDDRDQPENRHAQERFDVDFDIPEGHIPVKEELAACINRLIKEDHPVTFRWITDEEMAANQHLIRTMSVKPPTGTGKIRLVMIGEEGKVDLQPCGGTHVASTAGIGPIAVAKIENKGKINRRIRLVFA